MVATPTLNGMVSPSTSSAQDIASEARVGLVKSTHMPTRNARQLSGKSADDALNQGLSLRCPAVH